MVQTSERAWLLRPKPHGINRMHEFQDRKIIAIGWPGIGDLSGKSREELKQKLMEAPYQYSSLKLGNTYPILNIFVNLMNIDDLVLVPDDSVIYFAKITGEYHHESAFDNLTDGYPHQRQVTWLTSTPRENLSKNLRTALKVQRTAADLSHHAEEIQALAYGKLYSPTADAPKVLELSYPLRPDFTVTFSVPQDISKDEAQRLSVYFSTIYF